MNMDPGESAPADQDIDTNAPVSGVPVEEAIQADPNRVNSGTAGATHPPTPPAAQTSITDELANSTTAPDTPHGTAPSDSACDVATEVSDAAPQPSGSGNTSSIISAPVEASEPPPSKPLISSMGPPPPKQANSMLPPPVIQPKAPMAPPPPVVGTKLMAPPPPVQPKMCMAPPPPVVAAKSPIAPPPALESNGSMGPPAAVAPDAAADQPTQAAKKTAKGPLPPAPAYNPPPWAGVPEGIPYTLEVLKNGSIVGQTSVSAKPYYTFGRHPTNDWCLEHPSVSRLHAVLVYKGSTGEAFLFDAGSTHGTTVNKKAVKAKVHVPLRVGDTFKMGSSTRLFILGGPSELMPEEGLSREQKRQLVQLHAAERQRKRELELGAQQMQAAMDGGASWGMQEDAVEEEDPGAHIDWRVYAQTHPLTDHQRKIYDKIRKSEHTINSLKDQMSKIQAKEKHQDGGLTVGQAKVMVEGEVKVEQLTDELEDLEDLLTESIAHSISGKSGKDTNPVVSRKRKTGSDDDSSASDSEDEFYDRTGSRKKKKQSKAGPGKKAAEPEVENAATLHGKKSALLEEKQRLEAALQTEVEAASKATQQPVVEKDVVPADQEGMDSLDAFMTNIGASIEQSKVTSLKTEIADINHQLQRVERLLAIADPSGLYNPNKQSAQQARARALQLSSLEQKRKAAAAEALAKAKASPGHEENEQEEDEPEDTTTGEPATVTPSLAETAPSRPPHRPTVIHANPNPLLAQLGPKRTTQIHIPNRNPQSTTTHKPGSTNKGAATSHKSQPSGGTIKDDKPSTGMSQPDADDGVGASGGSRSHTNEKVENGSGAGISGGKRAADSAAEPLRSRVAGTKPRLRGPERTSGISFAQLEKDAATKVAQQLELLSKRGGSTNGGEVEAAAGSEDSNWKPPENQTGDGRTSLNDLYGY